MWTQSSCLQAAHGPMVETGRHIKNYEVSGHRNEKWRGSQQGSDFQWLPMHTHSNGPKQEVRGPIRVPGTRPDVQAGHQPGTQKAAKPLLCLQLSSVPSASHSWSHS